jgi:hypothetical protein
MLFYCLFINYGQNYNNVDVYEVNKDKTYFFVLRVFKYKVNKFGKIQNSK